MVVQDLFLTETAELADVVLPGGDLGREDRRFTNADRTVHLSERAVDPPGEARADLDIFLDYARRMDFRDRDGAPLIQWTDAAGAFEAWKACSKGRPCDYSGAQPRAAARRAASSGRARGADGTERLYTDGVLQHRPGRSPRRYGQDLVTGAARDRAGVPRQGARGRAFLHAADYHPSPEAPSDEFPLLLTTGPHRRTTSTPAPRPAARPSCRPPRPTSGSSCSRDGRRRRRHRRRRPRPRRARRAARSRRRRGSAASGPGTSSCRSTTATGTDGDGPARAANELTLTAWDPVSKQPLFKLAAVAVERAG